MNVMAKAHKEARFLKSTGVNASYRVVFKACLITAHKEYKAMQNNPFATMVEDCKARIAQLEAIEDRNGFIVVIGESARLPVLENSNGWCRVENASVFTHREDAHQLAVRVRNGNNEVGQVVKKIDQIDWEISEQQKLLETMQSHVNKG